MSEEDFYMGYRVRDIELMFNAITKHGGMPPDDALEAYRQGVTDAYNEMRQNFERRQQREIDKKLLDDRINETLKDACHKAAKEQSDRLNAKYGPLMHAVYKATERLEHP